VHEISTNQHPDGEAGVPVLGLAFPEAAALGEELAGAGMTVAVAESCTGGLLGAVLTATAGSSRYVRGGIIAYADDVKAEHLGVGRHLLATHGSVSAEVAVAMAVGAGERFEATIGVGITGVAGPAASEHKPAGLVFVAVVMPGSSHVVRLDEDLGREANRANAVHTALALIADAVAASRSDPGAAQSDGSLRR
jgi:PncC family amidohydrolase